LRVRASAVRASPRSRERRVLLRLAAVAAVVAFVALVTLGIEYDVPSGMAEHGGWACLALTFGVAVGASELVSRYRDEPVRATEAPAGLAYLGIMGLVSGLTYGLLAQYSSSIFPGLADDHLMMAIVAGFGAMAILRSKFFTLRTAAGEDIAVGPDAAISAFLAAADRGVDRTRASRRLELVSQEVARVGPSPTGTADFLEVSLQALQNLSNDDKRQFVEAIKSVKASAYPEQLKLQVMCFVLLNLTGERTFVDVMSSLDGYLKSGGQAVQQGTSAVTPTAPGAT
jgi:hypothetical protein